MIKRGIYMTNQLFERTKVLFDSVFSYFIRCSVMLIIVFLVFCFVSFKL